MKRSIAMSSRLAGRLEAAVRGATSGEELEQLAAGLTGRPQLLAERRLDRVRRAAHSRRKKRW